jgi:L-threonylcarbamoyladenylate synthase
VTTERLGVDSAGMSRAVEILGRGGLVAFPTDTVYGIGCRWHHEEALARLFQAKRRPVERQVPVLLVDLEAAIAAGYAADSRARRLAERFWPGPLTIVMPRGEAGAQAPEQRTVGFRVPDHTGALELIRRAGPLWTSSANRSGEPETLGADEVLVAFADTDLLDAVIDGGRVPGGVASTVVDVSVTPARVLREGPIDRPALAEVIGPLD